MGLITSNTEAATGARGRADGGYIIDTWDAEDGLPRNEVTAVLQSQDGYLWLGTLSGLVRFDGVHFTPFDESNTPGLKSSRIISLFEDSHGTLWIGTEGTGVFLLKEGRITPFAAGQESVPGRLASATEDPTGAVWLYMTDGSLWRCHQGTASRFALASDQTTDYRGLALEAPNSVLIGTDQRLFTADWRAPGLQVTATDLMGKLDLLLSSRQGGHWRLSDRRVQKWKRDTCEARWDWYPWIGQFTVKPTYAIEDQESNLIVGTSGAGVFWFNRMGEGSRISTNQGLSSNYILCLLMDREGDLWIGTDGGGLNRVRRTVFNVLEETRGLVPQSVSEDGQHGLWIGCNDGPGMYWKQGVLQPLREPARTVFVDREQRVWVGQRAGPGYPGLFQLREGRLQPVPGTEGLTVVSAIYQDRRGWIWVGTQRGLARWDQREWKHFNTRDGLSSDVIQAITDDAEGNVWVATGGGLCRWRDGQFTVYRKAEGGLPSDNVSALFVDSQGMLWIGTDGGGLARLQNEKWTRYTRREGLISNTITYIIEDRQGSLWLGSNAGLMRIQLNALNELATGQRSVVPCRVYGKQDGLPTRECSMGSQPAACQTGDGRLWFPTIKGLAWLDPAGLKPNLQPPPVTIESVLVGGHPQDLAALRRTPGSALRIPARSEGLEIRYTSLNLSAPERARFKSWLEGHENTWADVGDLRVARYGKLPPGHYHFRVTACNEDGIWNSVGTELSLVVLPPFWRTPWFLGSSAILLLGAVTALVHFVSTQRLQRQLATLRQQEALEKERSRIARDIHDQLGASLTQVALLGELVESDKDAPGEVELHARQISQTARETTRVLDEIVWAVNPSNDTLDGLMTYVCKYAQEYLAVAGVHYRFDVPSQLPHNSLPPEVRHNVFLACKEAVTNVVRHAKASEVRVRLRLEPETFAIEIQDNGRGLDDLNEKAAQARNGLKNMRKRMESIGGDFQFGPGTGGGTLVRLSAPLPHGPH